MAGKDILGPDVARPLDPDCVLDKTTRVFMSENGEALKNAFPEEDIDAIKSGKAITCKVPGCGVSVRFIGPHFEESSSIVMVMGRELCQRARIE